MSNIRLNSKDVIETLMADHTFKIILVGQSGVGKTSVVRRYVKRFFPLNDAPTIGVDIGIKLIEIDGVKIQLKIWDSAGSERFKSIATSYYRNADAAVLVYSINDSQSLYDLQSWSNEVTTHGEIFRILVGNKKDLEDERVISQDNAVNFALLENIDLAVECSAKYADNIDYIFHTLAQKLLEKKTEELITMKIVPRDSFLTYQGMSKSMENLFLSPKLKRPGETSVDPNLKFKQENVFKRFCTIL